MKTNTISALFLLLAMGCNQASESNAEENLPAETRLNVSYGSDPLQKMDVYLPEGRGASTKTIILLHGGGWSGGSKADLSYFIPILKSRFANHAIVNMNYRLGTASSPGFPKQIQDIEKAITQLKSGDFSISDQFAFIGISAGAHLAMLYAYRYDENQEIKAVASVVGPGDFSDPVYTQSPFFQYGLINLVGNVNPLSNPEIYLEVSPATHISAQSPPTILFYGGQDQLIPASQGPRLKARLDEYDVYNELHFYPEGGHGNWNPTVTADFQAKLIAFLLDKF
ncbi:MAG: alpha/beta hydrolase [Flavobacterium sp.]|nr:alpha/beta hydrolase [Flavobacterium sp.]